ncbi:TfoX/Sxy family protein [Methylomonas sp. UP202]|uniref:TfoX/Sxy family protein n=1 Tax=Methylomonas sp. UP202 TaxID=3040943 RepID=UPI002478CEA5|nr:TfoX/Sxy family protein [Methylomonas sp. UP202]WGS83894.1 TfoX/Sxy family protein [Methylomonas sp. UP202]
MASSDSTVAFILEQVSTAGEFRAKKMFGEYGLFCGDKMVALICDDQLYVKPTDQGKTFLGECPTQSPYRGAKPCFLIAQSQWHNALWLIHLLQLTASGLPPPKKRSTKLKPNT